MRLPWQKATEEETVPDEETPFTWEDEEDGEAGGEPAPEPPEDPLASLDENARRLYDEGVARAVQAERARIAGHARNRGFALTDDGDLAVADYNKVGGWLPVGRREEVPAAPVAPQAEAPDPMPDLFEDQAGWMAWNERQTQRRIEQATASLRAETERLQGLTAAPYQDSAIERAKTAAQGNPYLAAAFEHPDFAELFHDALTGATPEQLRNPRFLASATGVAAANLDPTRVPAPARDDQGRFTRATAHEVHREMAGRGTREAGPPRREPEGGKVRLNEYDRRLLQVVERDHGGEISREEWEDALEGDYFHYEKVMNQARARAKAGRR